MFVLLLAGLSGCDRARCEELSRVEVESAESTPAGSVDEVLEFDEGMQ